MRFNCEAVTVRAIQKLDRLAIEEVGIPSLVLMENAGRTVAEEVLVDLKGKKSPRVAIVCGTGNNGGDGFVAARHLLNRGIRTDVFVIGDERQLKQDPAVYYQVLKKIHCPMTSISTISPMTQRKLALSDRIVDAIFGVGLNRGIAEPYQSVIAFLNKLRKRIISIDIPSGLDGTTGKLYGICVKAQKTVTFTFPKQGFYKKEGPQYTGRIVIADIGIPKKLMNRIT